MTVFAETLTFDFAHTALVLVSVPVFVGLAAAAFSFVRGLSDRSIDLVFGSRARGTAPMWDVHHSRLRHRRPTWMTDRGTKWIVRRKRPERNQSADPSYLSHQ
jgi:hypothetical protein